MRTFFGLSCSALLALSLVAAPAFAVGDRGLIVAQSMPMPQGNGIAPNGKNEAGSDMTSTSIPPASATTSGSTGLGAATNTSSYSNNLNGSANGSYGATAGTGINAPQGTHVGTGVGAGANAGGTVGTTP